MPFDPSLFEQVQIFKHLGDNEHDQKDHGRKKKKGEESNSSEDKSLKDKTKDFMGEIKFDDDLTKEEAITLGVIGLTAAATIFIRNHPKMLAHRQQWLAKQSDLPDGEFTDAWRAAFNPEAQARDVRFAAKEMFEGEFGSDGFKTQILSARPNRLGSRGGPRAVTVVGYVKDGATPVGQFSRTLSSSGEVHHDFLSLGKSAQGTGFAKDWYDHTIKGYEKAGFTEVTMLANIDVGGYAWASEGFDFKYERDVHRYRSSIKSEIELLYEGKGKKAPKELLDEVDSLSTPRELSQFGRDNPDLNYIRQPEPLFGETEGLEMWVGKDAFLGSNWEATKPLGDAPLNQVKSRRAATMSEEAISSIDPTKWVDAEGMLIKQPPNDVVWEAINRHLDAQTPNPVFDALNNPPEGVKVLSVERKSIDPALREILFGAVDDVEKTSSLPESVAHLFSDEERRLFDNMAAMGRDRP